jgi:hypothetical protein
MALEMVPKAVLAEPLPAVVLERAVGAAAPAVPDSHRQTLMAVASVSLSTRPEASRPRLILL